MRFDGSVSDIGVGTFLPENRRLDCHFWSDSVAYGRDLLLGAEYCSVT